MSLRTSRACQQSLDWTFDVVLLTPSGRWILDHPDETFVQRLFLVVSVNVNEYNIICTVQKRRGLPCTGLLV